MLGPLQNLSLQSLMWQMAFHRVTVSRLDVVQHQGKTNCLYKAVHTLTQHTTLTERQASDFDSLPCSHAYLQHIAHEGLWVCTSGCVDDEGNHSREARGKGFCDDSPRRRPCEDFYLARSINNDILQWWITLLLTKTDDLQPSQASTKL